MKVEVKEAQSNEVDWTKNPQLVVSEIGQIVIVSTNQLEAIDIECFCGIQIDDKSSECGYYSDGWVKESFKPFHGEITLKND